MAGGVANVVTKFLIVGINDRVVSCAIGGIIDDMIGVVISGA